MAPIVVSSFFPAAAPRLLLRMATPQPIAQHEHARVRFVQRHEVPFCARGCWVFFFFIKKEKRLFPIKRPKSNGFVFIKLRGHQKKARRSGSPSPWPHGKCAAPHRSALGTCTSCNGPARAARGSGRASPSRAAGPARAAAVPGRRRWRSHRRTPGAHRPREASPLAGGASAAQKRPAGKGVLTPPLASRRPPHSRSRPSWRQWQSRREPRQSPQ